MNSKKDVNGNVDIELQSGGLSFSQRALQYLIRLSSTARNDLALEGMFSGSAITST